MVPVMIIVGADKGGVGKTTTSRLIVDYINARSSGCRVFDADPPNGSLKRFFPWAEVVNLMDTRDMARVIDGVHGSKVTFVDLRAALLSRTLGLMGDWGLLADVAAGRIRLVVMHVLGPSTDSLLEAADVSGLLSEGGDHYLVRNSLNSERFEWIDGNYAPHLERIGAKATISIPHLDGVAREAVDAAGSGFDDFVKDEARSFLHRRIVRKWVNDCHAQFDAVALKTALRATP